MLEFLLFFADGPLRILIFSVSFRFHFGTQRGHNQMIFSWIYLPKQCYIFLLLFFFSFSILLYYFTSYSKFNLSKMKKKSQYIFITEKYDNFFIKFFHGKNCTALALSEYFISYYYYFFVVFFSFNKLRLATMRAKDYVKLINKFMECAQTAISWDVIHLLIILLLSIQFFKFTMKMKTIKVKDTIEWFNKLLCHLIEIETPRKHKNLFLCF